VVTVSTKGTHYNLASTIADTMPSRFSSIVVGTAFQQWRYSVIGDDPEEVGLNESLSRHKRKLWLNHMSSFLYCSVPSG
jgi:hypothetical protein